MYARALITGASAGLGAEFARQLAAQGKDLILVARRVTPMEKMAAELRDEYNVQVDVLQSDLSVAGSPALLHGEIDARHLVVDFLINNAGSHGPDLIEDRDWAAHERYIELMMTSVAAMCHQFLPDMVHSGSGRVINVASVAGLVSLAGDYSYGPTKSYLIALSKSLALSMRDKGINVSVLCPGFTHTDFHASERLTRMKNGMPKFLWYDADVVVRDGLRAVEKGRPVCISGRLYRLLVPLIRSPIGEWALGRAGVSRKNY